MAIPGTLFRVLMTGTRPLLVSSSEGVAPRGPIGKRLKELYAKGSRKRTEKDNDEMAELKYHVALYCDDEGIGPYLPGFNVWAAGRDGAKLHRQGAAWIRGVQVIEDKLPLQYPGPRTIAGLYDDPRFVDVRAGRLSGGAGSVPVIRPIFPQWQIEATFVVNDSMISVGDAQRAIEMAGEAIGLGTFRQRFGRFDVEVLNNSRVKKAA